MKLNLDIVAATLEGLEETIISKLIDRAQFKANGAAYFAGKSGFEGEQEKSLFDLKLYYQEQIDALFGRYCVPEERPFTAGLPKPQRQVFLPETGLSLADFNTVNLTAEIKLAYRSLIPEICPDGDDRQYGSATEHDVFVLQALSRRIHYGALYVAECKYQQEPGKFASLITGGDAGALTAALTRSHVEEKILERVREKVAVAQAKVNTKVRFCIESDVVLQFYRDHIIPLTKKGQVEYLLKRKA